MNFGTMNCDQVFDILTRGPFPTGTSCDGPVEAHLAECLECHRLAEALRPAVELFQEAVDPEESRDLPGYFSAAAVEPQVLSYATESYGAELEPRREPLHHRAHAAGCGVSSAAAWRMVAMVALGVTVGTLLSNRAIERFEWPPRGGAAAVAPPPADEGARMTQADWMELASLPAACYRRKPDHAPRYRLRDDQLLASAKLENLACCSGCHNAASDSVPSSATMKVALSCRHCHENSVAPVGLQ